MAMVRIPAEGRMVKDFSEVKNYLAGVQIEYERWTPAHPVASDASEQEILQAYAGEIEQLKRRGGYVPADVVDAGADIIPAKSAR